MGTWLCSQPKAHPDLLWQKEKVGKNCFMYGSLWVALLRGLDENHVFTLHPIPTQSYVADTQLRIILPPFRYLTIHRKYVTHAVSRKTKSEVQPALANS